MSKVKSSRGSHYTTMRPVLKLGFSRGALIAAAIFWIVVLLLVLNRHYSMYPSYTSHDQSILNQVFWNSAHGRFFQSSLSSGLSSAVLQDGEIPTVFYRRLGQHFTPAHFLWLPLYAIFPASATLLVLQVSLVTAAGLVLYLLARQRLSDQISTWITISFFCTTAIIGPTLANFHDFSQVPLFTFAILLALDKKQWGWFAAMVFFLLMAREDTGIVLFGIGFYLLASRRYPRLGLGLCTLALGYVLILTNFVMPLFSDEVSRHFMVDHYGQYVQDEAPSTFSVLVSIVSQPLRLIQEVFTPFSESVRYVLGHWLPLAFIPAVSPAAWAISGFPLLAILLRQDVNALSMQMRYAMIVVPGLFYGAILWWSQRPAKLRPRFRNFWAVCIGLSLFFTLTLNPNRAWSFVIPDSIDPWVYVSLPRQWSHVQQVRSLFTQIPADASVSASNHLLPHLSSRREILRFPDLTLQNDAQAVVMMDYVILDLWQLQQYQPAFADDRTRLSQWIPLINQLIEQGTYGAIACQDGILLMQHQTPSTPEALDRWNALRQELEASLQQS